MITGALVRLTGSGLGCESWPGCQEGSFFPEVGEHSTIEFGNRVVASSRSCSASLAWIAAPRTPGLPRWATWIAPASSSARSGRRRSGCSTIRLDLHPLMVVTHFLLALVVLAGAIVVAVEAWGHAVGRVGSPGAALAAGGGARARRRVRRSSSSPGRSRRPPGPHPGDSAEIDRLLEPRRRGLRRTSARPRCSGSRSCSSSRWLVRERRRVPGPGAARRGAARGSCLLQMAVGEIQCRNQLPWWLVLVHVGLAAAVWALDGGARDRSLADRPRRSCRTRLSRWQARSYASRRARRCERPVLVAAFRGWNDGGQGATLAGGYLARIWDAERFAEIDPEGFVDFQSNRPARVARRRADAHDRLARERLLPRADPGRRARRDPAARGRAEPPLANVLRARGRPRARLRGRARGHARLAPRRRAAHAARAGDGSCDRSRRSSRRSGSQPSRYEGPTGIVGVLQDACRERGIPAASLWAAVPHYVSLAPSPRAAPGALRPAGRAARRDRSTRTSSRRPRSATPSR